MEGEEGSAKGREVKGGQDGLDKRKRWEGKEKIGIKTRAEEQRQERRSG